MKDQGWIQSSSSDLHKSLKFLPNNFSQLVISLHEINYPSCVIFYYEIKQMRNYAVDRIANPAPSEGIRRVSVRAISSFVDTSESNAKKIRRHDRTRLLSRGCTLLFSRITQNQLRLVRITRIVLRTTQTRL